MKNIEYQTMMIVREIKKSNEYNQYHRLKSKLSKDPDLYKKMNEFRKRSLEFQLRSDGEPYEESISLRTEFENILSNPIVNEFMVSEQRLCNMMRNINNSLVKAIDMDVEFLN